QPRMRGFGQDIANEVDYKLAYCYEKLGRAELAQRGYEQIVSQNPEHGPALAGIERMKLQRGLATADVTQDPVQKAVGDMLKKPKSEQNWDQVEAEVDKYAKTHKVEETTLRLVKAQIALAHEDFDLAQKYVNEAREKSPDNLQIYRFAIQIARANPKAG